MANTPIKKPGKLTKKHGTTIAKCNCVPKKETDAAHWQDVKYGMGMRVHNYCKVTSTGYSIRCTCCGKETVK